MEIDIKGYKVLIDDEDYEKVSQLSWYIQYDGNKYKNHVYFYHGFSDNSHKKHNISLQRFLMQCRPKDGKVVDHISGDTLDNRKSNLRICTFIENVRNQKRRNDNTTGYKGVYYDKCNNLYRARISKDKKRIYLGYYKTAEEAYQAYCNASKEYHGEFGRIA